MQSVSYAYCSYRSAQDILPSFLRKRKAVSSLGKNTGKRTKSIQVWDRDICIPDSKSSQNISYPRGKYRSQLGEDGLIGKIRLISTMTESEVMDEVRSVFQEAMSNRSDFPFVFLQPTGSGARTLTAPSVSNSFCWTAQQVAKLGGHKCPIYILAKDKLTLPEVCILLNVMRLCKHTINCIYTCIRTRLGKVNTLIQVRRTVGKHFNHNLIVKRKIVCCGVPFSLWGIHMLHVVKLWVKLIRMWCLSVMS